MPAHDFHQECPVMRGSRHAQAVDGFDRSVERGRGADANVGATQVVVDGRCDADHSHAASGERVGAGLRAIAADDDERMDVTLCVTVRTPGPDRRWS